MPDVLKRCSKCSWLNHASRESCHWCGEPLDDATLEKPSRDSSSPTLPRDRPELDKLSEWEYGVEEPAESYVKPSRFFKQMKITVFCIWIGAVLCLIPFLIAALITHDVIVSRVCAAFMAIAFLGALIQIIVTGKHPGGPPTSVNINRGNLALFPVTEYLGLKEPSTGNVNWEKDSIARRIWRLLPNPFPRVALH